MGTLRFILDYANDDSTLDLNNRLFGITTPGIVIPSDSPIGYGELTPVTGQLKIDVGDFSAITYDGATVLHTGTTTLDVVDGIQQYVLLKAKYLIPNSDYELLVLSWADWAASPDKNWMQRIASINLLGGGFVDVPLNRISYRVSDRIDAISRTPYRGTVPTAGDLPLDPDEDYCVADDIYLVLAEHILYYCTLSPLAWHQMTNVIAVTSTWHNGETPAWTTPQEVADGVVSELADDTGPTGCGSDRIGSEGETGVTGAGHTVDTLDLSRGSIRDQLVQLLTALNESPRIAQNEVINGQWDFSNILQLLGSTGYVQADQPLSGGNPRVLRIARSYVHPTAGDVAIWESLDSSTSEPELFLTVNCYWDAAVTRWKPVFGNRHAYAIRLLNEGIILYRKDKTDPNPVGYTGGWALDSAAPVTGWTSASIFHKNHTVGKKDIYATPVIVGWSYERIPFYFYFYNWAADDFVIPGAGHTFSLPVQYRVRYESDPFVTPIPASAVIITVTSHPLTVVAGNKYVNTESRRWGCWLDIQPGSTVFSGTAFYVEGYVEVPNQSP